MFQRYPYHTCPSSIPSIYRVGIIHISLLYLKLVHCRRAREDASRVPMLSPGRHSPTCQPCTSQTRAPSSILPSHPPTPRQARASHIPTPHPPYNLITTTSTLPPSACHRASETAPPHTSIPPCTHPRAQIFPPGDDVDPTPEITPSRADIPLANAPIKGWKSTPPPCDNFPRRGTYASLGRACAASHLISSHPSTPTLVLNNSPARPPASPLSGKSISRT